MKRDRMAGGMEPIVHPIRDKTRTMMQNEAVFMAEVDGESMTVNKMGEDMWAMERRRRACSQKAS